MRFYGVIGLFFYLAFLSGHKQVFAIDTKSSSDYLQKDVTSMVILLVDKSRLKAELRTWTEDPLKSEVLTSFRIAIGKVEGDKQYEGDNKTPEGIYFAQSHLDGRKLPAKYGPMAIPINFPNPIDKIYGKTGHGIWLHGVERDKRIEAAKVTEGCVAFYNADIVSLTKWMRPHQSLIMIAKNGEMLNRPKDVDSLTRRTMAWVNAWEKRSVGSYIDFYADNFRHNGKRLSQYRRYKKRVFSSYQKMTLNMQDVRVLTHANYGMTIMNQYFNGDNRYISKGRKILYWEKDKKGVWKIRFERFERRPLEFIRFSKDEFVSIGKKTSAKRVDSKVKRSGYLN